MPGKATASPARRQYCVSCRVRVGVSSSMAPRRALHTFGGGGVLGFGLVDGEEEERPDADFVGVEGLAFALHVVGLGASPEGLHHRHQLDGHPHLQLGRQLHRNLRADGSHRWKEQPLKSGVEKRTTMTK